MTSALALVVDDESMVRHLVRRILEPEVCDVVDAEDGETALRLIQQGPESIDVVLTDLAMPGIDGFAVVEVLARHYPHLPVVCMSGYMNQLNATRQLTVPFLQKPFTVETLRETVVPLIERSRALRMAARAEQQRAVDGRGTSERLSSRSRETFAAAVDLVAAARALRASRANPERPS